jgi:uncharacterized protein (TIGR03437 family)
MFSAAANATGSQRIGHMQIANQTVTVMQAAANCNYSVSPTSQNYPVSGGSGNFAINANCAWQVSQMNSWVATAYASGIANATIPYTVIPNGCVVNRSLGITVVTGLPPQPVFTVTQDGSAANFSLSATSATADAAAGDGRFTVNTGTGCAWSATSDVSWMTLTAGATGSGNGTIAYHLIANNSSARTGNIHINTSPNTQVVFTVTQQAAGPAAPVLSSVTNAANYASDAVSPGEIVTLFGRGMGPAALVTLQVVNGALTNNLGGTQVLFDGTAAPMIYSSQGQVSAIAPYGLAGKTTTAVTVSYNGVASNAVNMPVQASTPAIFSLDSTGLGPGAILNQDFTINSTALAAARGSTVQIYCTGGGTNTPAVADGAVVGSPTPNLNLPATVTIGGVNAPVSYAGGVPGSVAGLVQVNAQVPSNAPTGNGIAVVVKIGTASSTAGITMSVK